MSQPASPRDKTPPNSPPKAEHAHESPVAVADNNNNNQVHAEEGRERRERGRRLKNMTGLSGLMFMIAVVILAHGISQIVIATQKDGLLVRHTWGILINGIFCTFLGLCGLSVVCCSFVRRFFKLYAMLNLFVFVEAILVYIIYSGLVHRYIRDDCGGHYQWNDFCYDLEKYLGISLAVFWCFNLFVLPASLITSVALVKANDDESASSSSSSN